MSNNKIRLIIIGCVLIKVRDLHHSSHIWGPLHQQFNTDSFARVGDLRRTLVTLTKLDSQTMDDYLRLIKVTVDSLASINSPVVDSDLVHYTISGLPPSYESFVTTVMYMPGTLTFDDLRSKLVFYEH